MTVTKRCHDGLCVAAVGGRASCARHRSHHCIGTAIGKCVSGRARHIVRGPSHRCARGRVGGGAGLTVTKRGHDGLRVAAVGGRASDTACGSN